MNSGRPIIRDLERSGIDITLEVLGLIGILFLIGLSAYYYPHLPNLIPQHFNWKGEPDGWGSKSFLLTMPIIGVALFALLTVLSRFPHVFNYPWAITELNARRQYAISRQLLSVVKLVLIATFSYITWSMIGTALGQQHGLGLTFLMVEPALLLVIIGLYFYRANRAQ